VITIAAATTITTIPSTRPTFQPASAASIVISHLSSCPQLLL
jgi:hypothetical protein